MTCFVFFKAGAERLFYVQRVLSLKTIENPWYRVSKLDLLLVSSQAVRPCSCGSVWEHQPGLPTPCPHWSCCCYIPSVLHAKPVKYREKQNVYNYWPMRLFNTLWQCIGNGLLSWHLVRDESNPMASHHAGRWSQTPRDFNVKGLHNVSCDFPPVISWGSYYCGHCWQSCFLKDTRSFQHR